MSPLSLLPFLPKILLHAWPLPVPRSRLHGGLPPLCGANSTQQPPDAEGGDPSEDPMVGSVSAATTTPRLAKRTTCPFHYNFFGQIALQVLMTHRAHSDLRRASVNPHPRPADLRVQFCLHFPRAGLPAITQTQSEFAQLLLTVVESVPTLPCKACKQGKTTAVKTKAARELGQGI